MRDGSGRPAQIPLSIVKTYPDPVTVMNGYDPNSDENWLKEYLVGQTTGGGWGTYGEIGNQAYRARQHREAEQRRQISPPVHTSSAVDPPITVQPAPTQESWSTVWATLGFLAGAFTLYDPVDPSWGASVAAGLFTGYLTGRFYKALLLIGAVLLALQVYYSA
jgi:hypothetical protein